MPICRDGKSPNWYVDIATPSGKRIRRSTGTADKKAAEEYHDRLKAELWRVQRLGEKPKRSFDEVALRWLKEKQGKKDIVDDKTIIKFWRQHLTMAVHEIKGGQALEIVNLLEVSNARKNKYIAILRAMLRRAEKVWEWIDESPNFTMFAEPKRRIRSLTREQAQTLITELPEHQQRTVLFALATGLRQGNVLGLTWDRVDLVQRVAYIDGEDFKNGENHGVPLNDTAVDIIRECLGHHQTHVFTYRCKPIKQANTKAWRKALTRAGIDSFRWHDLRHAVATWLVQDGTPLFAVQEFFGWKDGKMVRRYAHLAPQQLATYAAGLDSRLSRNFAGAKKKATG